MLPETCNVAPRAADGENPEPIPVSPDADIAIAVVPDEALAVARVAINKFPLLFRIDASKPDPDILKNKRVDCVSDLVSVYITAPVTPVPLTVNKPYDDVVPIIVLPEASIVNGVASGLAESSTLKALPVPVCVILTKSVVVEPVTVRLPVKAYEPVNCLELVQ